MDSDLMALLVCYINIMGLSFGFSGDYNEYFNPEWVDNDANNIFNVGPQLIR